MSETKPETTKLSIDLFRIEESKTKDQTRTINISEETYRALAESYSSDASGFRHMRCNPDKVLNQLLSDAEYKSKYERLRENVELIRKISFKLLD